MVYLGFELWAVGCVRADASTEDFTTLLILGRLWTSRFVFTLSPSSRDAVSRITKFPEWISSSRPEWSSRLQGLEPGANVIDKL